MTEYSFIASAAYQLLNACPECGGNALYVMGLSQVWQCVLCGQQVHVELPEKEDPRLDVYKETLEKLG